MDDSKLANPEEFGRWIVSEYDALRQLAHLYLERLSNGEKIMLQSSDFVQTLFVKACERTDIREKFAYSAQAFRNQIVDMVRDSKSPSGTRMFIPFDDDSETSGSQFPMHDLMEVHDVLEKLYSFNKFHGRIAELKCCLGFTDEQTAMDLGVSRAKISRDWGIIRIWLINALGK